jgi:hypothetical protein
MERARRQTWKSYHRDYVHTETGYESHRKSVKKYRERLKLTYGCGISQAHYIRRNEHPKRKLIDLD